MSDVPQEQIVSSHSPRSRWGFMWMCILCRAMSASTTRGKLRGVTSISSDYPPNEVVVMSIILISLWVTHMGPMVCFPPLSAGVTHLGPRLA
jgi:hypothetical protein